MCSCRKGSGFTARHGDDFLMANNAQWIGFSLEIGPEGALYVLDWHDGDICGQDVLHQETGRIFRIAPKTVAGRAVGGPLFGSAQDDRRAARRAADEPQRLARAPGPRHPAGPRGEAHAASRRRTTQLRRLFRTDANPDWRLRAMWALHVTGGWTPDALAPGARGSRTSTFAPGRFSCSPRIARRRAMALEQVRPDGARRPLAGRAAVSGVGASAHRPRGRAGTIAGELMTHGEDAADHNLPKMLWLGVEPLVAGESRARPRTRGRRATSRWSPGSSRGARSMPTRSSRSSPRLEERRRRRSACWRACATASRDGST